MLMCCIHWWCGALRSEVGGASFPVCRPEFLWLSVMMTRASVALIQRAQPLLDIYERLTRYAQCITSAGLRYHRFQDASYVSSVSSADDVFYKTTTFFLSPSPHVVQRPNCRRTLHTYGQSEIRKSMLFRPSAINWMAFRPTTMHWMLFRPTNVNYIAHWFCGHKFRHRFMRDKRFHPSHQVATDSRNRFSKRKHFKTNRWNYTQAYKDMP